MKAQRKRGCAAAPGRKGLADEQRCTGPRGCKRRHGDAQSREGRSRRLGEDPCHHCEFPPLPLSSLFPSPD